MCNETGCGILMKIRCRETLYLIDDEMNWLNTKHSDILSGNTSYARLGRSIYREFKVGALDIGYTQKQRILETGASALVAHSNGTHSSPFELRDARLNLPAFKSHLKTHLCL